MGLLRGLWAPYRGAVFVFRHRLFGLLTVALLLNAALALFCGWLALRLVDRWVPAEAHSIWLDMGRMLAVAVTALLAFVTLQPITSAPFVDTLTERVEIIVKGGHPRPGFWLGLGQAVWHGVLKSALYLGAVGLTVGLGVLTGAGGLLGVAVTGLFLAFDGFDYPLARRRVGFGGKWGYLLRHPGLTVGYAVGASLLFLIPLAFILAPPVAAVGATLAYLDTERNTGPLPLTSDAGDGGQLSPQTAGSSR